MIDTFDPMTQRKEHRGWSVFDGDAFVKRLFFLLGGYLMGIPTCRTPNKQNH